MVSKSGWLASYQCMRVTHNLRKPRVQYLGRKEDEASEKKRGADDSSILQVLP